MSDTFLTLIVPTANVELARSVAAAMDPGGAGMWTTPLSPSGQEPATHWISTGWVPAAWQVIVPTQTWEQEEDGTWIKTSETPGDPILVYERASEAGIECTQADIDALFSVADVTQQDPWIALARLGLVMVQSPPPRPDDAIEEG